jgi:predicted HTH domain antitoxin
MVVEQWQLTQVFKLSQQQPNLVGRALDDLFHEHADLWRAVVVGAYLDREINLGRVAELLGVSRAEMQKQFIAQGVPLRIGSLDLAEARAEADAIETWRKNDSSAQ